ncbi:WAT1-related protein At5g40240-like [Pistacia vera]|uniref:WAT1-related protein At5g40240-like n=1 Tax=Pistacia vera TaxID=55513 RepID=UPI001262EAE4|nr:WAT1-related protein At5g40240-like [Pistacia vera]
MAMNGAGNLHNLRGGTKHPSECGNFLHDDDRNRHSGDDGIALPRTFVGVLTQLHAAWAITLFRAFMRPAGVFGGGTTSFDSSERNPNSWTLRADMELIAILYSAVFGVALRNLVHAWACHKKGPVYVSMFKPVGIIIAVVMGVTLLGDTLYLGSITGGSIIAFGFYSALWGQAQEEKMVDDKGINCSKSSSPNAPLLENRSMEI